MNIAWLASPYTADHNNPRLLPGTVGGAEMLDKDMFRHLRAAGHLVNWINADQWEHAEYYERIIITQTEFLPDEAIATMGDWKPLVWVRHLQEPRPGLEKLFRKADPFVTMSDLHARVEGQAWSVTPEVCHGWLDLGEIVHGDGDGTALWAARNHPQKGLIGARLYARNMGWELVEITDSPRPVVLDAMTRASHFVFFPKGLDACPRTLIEAEAAGCEIHAGHLAGRVDPGPLDEVLDRHLRRFLGWF